VGLVELWEREMHKCFIGKQEGLMELWEREMHKCFIGKQEEKRPIGIPRR
jgi:hypothetical protein